MSGPLAVTLFVIGMLASIMIHEWGHFATARRFGMRADRFFVGFGPTLWSTRRGETEYGVKALPLGGFVRIRGMGEADERRPPAAVAAFDPDALAADRATAGATTVVSAPTWDRLDAVLDERGTPRDVRERLLARARAEVGPGDTPRLARDRFDAIVREEVGVDDDPRSLSWRLLRGDEGRFFHDRPPLQRAIVLAAGSALHMVQAVVLLFLLALVVGGGAIPLPEAAQVVPDSAADLAGLEVGDELVSIDGIAIEDFAQARALIERRGGRATEFVVRRDGVELSLVGTPTPTEDPTTGEVVGRFGFVPAGENVGLPPLAAAREAVTGEGGILRLSGATLSSLGSVFGPDGIGQVFSSVADGEERDPNGGVSLVGAGQFASSAANEVGVFVTVVGLLASINIFIGIFNILPLPPLDGGHLAVLGTETLVNGVRRVRGRPADFRVDQRTVAAIAIPVIAIIGTVSLGLLWLDVTNPVTLTP